MPDLDEKTISAADIINQAIDLWNSTECLNLGAIAERLGVDMATLHRIGFVRIAWDAAREQMSATADNEKAIGARLIIPDHFKVAKEDSDGRL